VPGSISFVHALRHPLALNWWEAAAPKQEAWSCLQGAGSGVSDSLEAGGRLHGGVGLRRSATACAVAPIVAHRATGPATKKPASPAPSPRLANPPKAQLLHPPHHLRRKSGGPWPCLDLTATHPGQANRTKDYHRSAVLDNPSIHRCCTEMGWWKISLPHRSDWANHPWRACGGDNTSLLRTCASRLRTCSADATTRAHNTSRTVGFARTNRAGGEAIIKAIGWRQGIISASPAGPLSKPKPPSRALPRLNPSISQPISRLSEEV